MSGKFVIAFVWRSDDQPYGLEQTADFVRALNKIGDSRVRWLDA